jgi:hypothetical protein
MQRAAAAVDGVDSVSVTGGRLEIRMAGGAARELMAAGSARIRQARVPGSGGAPILTRMEGDTIRIGVERGILREARSTGSARSVHRDRQGAEMSLEAGRLTVAFEDGRARRVRAEEKARAEHASGDGAERSRMSADRVEAEMAGERVEAVLLQGRALLEYLPAPRPSGKKGGRDRLTGESIRLGFREGLLVRAAVRGGAMGTYWLSDQERGGN